MDLPHIPIERTVRFLLDGLVLTPDEFAHLVKCDQCRREMVESASEELDKRYEKIG